jgi:hypothetical protein
LKFSPGLPDEKSKKSAKSQHFHGKISLQPSWAILEQKYSPLGCQVPISGMFSPNTSKKLNFDILGCYPDTPKTQRKRFFADFSQHVWQP